MEIDLNQKSEYGDFDLIPLDGHQLRAMVDLESHLLIITESLIDTSQIPSTHGMKMVPSSHYVIDTKLRKILTPSEWTKYFSYDEIIVLSEDGKLKEVVQRIHEPERNTDSFTSQLFDLKSGKVISGGTSIAFSDKPGSFSLMESYYENIETQKSYLKDLELGEYPDDKHIEYCISLADDQVVIQCSSAIEVLQLRKKGTEYILLTAPMPTSLVDWEHHPSTRVSKFKSLADFWTGFKSSALQKWYVEFTLRIKHFAIEKYIIGDHNALVQNQIIPYVDYMKLHAWMNINFNFELNQNVFWQFCSNCRKRVFYNPRYPNHACRNCVTLIKDQHGHPLDYRDMHLLKHTDGNSVVVLKETDEPVKLFINHTEYWASEAYFGGVVHQLKEAR